jgi:hypothetical protein
MPAIRQVFQLPILAILGPCFSDHARFRRSGVSGEPASGSLEWDHGDLGDSGSSVSLTINFQYCHPERRANPAKPERAQVEGSRECFPLPCSFREFSKKIISPPGPTKGCILGMFRVTLASPRRGLVRTSLNKTVGDCNGSKPSHAITAIPAILRFLAILSVGCKQIPLRFQS